MAYKKDVDDPRESPGLELMELLLQKGAIVQYNDPHIPRLPRTRRHPNLNMESQELTPEYLESRDCVVIVTDHSAYDWERIVVAGTVDCGHAECHGWRSEPRRTHCPLVKQGRGVDLSNRDIGSITEKAALALQ